MMGEPVARQLGGRCVGRRSTCYQLTTAVKSLSVIRRDGLWEQFSLGKEIVP